MITDIDVRIANLELAASQCNPGWYQSPDHVSEDMGHEPEDFEFIHAASPELILKLIRRLRAAEAKK